MLSLAAARRGGPPGRRRAVGLVALMVCVLAAALAPARESRASKLTWMGLDQDVRVYGSYGRGSRWGAGGNQFAVSFDGAMFGKASPLGNVAGLEFGAMMGYDGVSYRENDQVLGDLGFLFDLSVGFPITLFHLFSGRTPRLMVGIAPGFGISMVSAYTYLTAKAAFRVAPAIVIEGQWTWWPGAASHPVGETNDSVNAAMARATAYIGQRRQGALMVYAELYEGQRESERGTGGNASKVLFGGKDPYGSTARAAYEDFFRLGVGYAF